MINSSKISEIRQKFGEILDAISKTESKEYDDNAIESTDCDLKKANQLLKEQIDDMHYRISNLEYRVEELEYQANEDSIKVNSHNIEISKLKKNFKILINTIGNLGGNGE